jgi:hypothetical protein
MVTKLSNRGKTIVVGLVSAILSVLLGSLLTATPARAASNVQIDWIDTTTIRLSGSAVSNPVNVAGDFVGNVSGTPAGSQTYMATSNGPVTMTFGCTVSMTLNIIPDASGNLDFAHGELIFTTSSPATCSQAVLQANISGLTHNPNSGTANLSLMNAPVGGASNRGPSGGTDSSAQQIVNVTAGMGPASDYNGIPQTDVFMLCEAKGPYATNVDSLIADCLARKTGTLSANPQTSNSLQTINDGKGPQGGPEKGWAGQLKGVKAGIYVVCSTNFKSCQLFTKNPGQIADVYVRFGSTTGSTVPGTPPGQGAPEQVCTTGDGLAGNLAWILCPAVQLIASATAFFENNIIIPFLTTSPLTTNASNPIYILWQNIRNVANVGFIIFFFFVIFSQATSIGISNYGIKRILPKMVVVVVGMNLSYFIVAFIIDAFNIFGAGISQLVVAALQQAGTTQLNSGSSAGTVRSIFTLGGAALLTVIVAGGAAIGWFFSFLGLALLIVAVVVIVLIVRQIAIIMLVIVSPVPILMYMLPNTEAYFNKWRKMLIQLLMMYPLIVLLFAAGKVFGIILQQPDFKIAGDGVSDQVAQAIRVILQFLVYIVPLVFLPATFAASGSVMGRAYGWFNNKAIQPRAKRLGEDASHLGSEARMRVANNRLARGVGIGQLAGRSLRKNYVREQRRGNLKREQESYVAGAVGGTGLSSRLLRRQAAGVAGQTGATRAAAGASQVVTKGRAEDIDNEMALLDQQMLELGTNRKEFASATARYYQDKKNNAVFTSPTGKTFNFAKNESQLQRALLNSAADQGEITAIEAARLSTSDERYQKMLDDIVRRNDGTLKGKGGYHLATNFKLAPGRMLRSDAEGKGLATDGSEFKGLPGQVPDYLQDESDMKAEMLKQRLLVFAGSGANSIAGMKAGLLGDTAKVLERINSGPPAVGSANYDEALKAYNQAAAAFTGIDMPLRRKIFDRVDEIVGNQNTLARSEGGDDIKKIRSVMQSWGYTHTP